MTALTDLTGQVAVVTGGTDGIGAASALALRSRGAEVVILGRSQQKADRLLGPAPPSTPSGSLHAIVSDFASMSNVVSAVGRLTGHVPRIDLLLHAVGVLHPRSVRTQEGLDEGFAISYLSRFVFLETAAEHGLLHAGTRMVNVAASAPRVPRFAQVEFTDPEAVRTRSGMRAHGQAQLANDLLTAAAPARYGITATGYGPGAVDTSIRREVPAVLRAALRPLYARTTRRPNQAAADILAAFTDGGQPPHTARFRNRHGSFPPAAFITDQRRQQDLIDASLALTQQSLQQRPPG